MKIMFFFLPQKLDIAFLRWYLCIVINSQLSTKNLNYYG